MFVHLVLIKLKPGIQRNDPRVRAWQPMMAALPRKCKGIVYMEYGWNTTGQFVLRMIARARMSDTRL